VTYDEWKAEAERFADEIGLLLESIWADSDPYDLFEAAQAAFDNGQTPREFINEIFEDDIARQAYDDHLFDESLRSQESDDEST